MQKIDVVVADNEDDASGANKKQNQDNTANDTIIRMDPHISGEKKLVMIVVVVLHYSSKMACFTKYIQGSPNSGRNKTEQIH